MGGEVSAAEWLDGAALSSAAESCPGDWLTWAALADWWEDAAARAAGDARAAAERSAQRVRRRAERVRAGAFVVARGTRWWAMVSRVYEATWRLRPDQWEPAGAAGIGCTRDLREDRRGADWMDCVALGAPAAASLDWVRASGGVADLLPGHWCYLPWAGGPVDVPRGGAVLWRRWGDSRRIGVEVHPAHPWLGDESWWV